MNDAWYFQAVVSREKLLGQVLSATSDENIPERIKGSHHIFSKEGVAEILNLQPKGSKAKAYQVKQLRNVFRRYKLAGSDET